MLADTLGAVMDVRSFTDRLSASGRYPPAPDGLTLYLVGDIHGRLDLLRKVHYRIDEDKARRGGVPAGEIYLGDYIDRGPDSAGVMTGSTAMPRALARRTSSARPLPWSSLAMSTR